VRTEYGISLLPHGNRVTAPVAEFTRKRDLKSIGIRDITRYVRHRQNGEASPNTILKEPATLSGIFRDYLTEEMILSNPVLAVKKLKLRRIRP